MKNYDELNVIVVILLNSLLMNARIYLPQYQIKTSLYDSVSPDVQKLYLNFHLQSVNIIKYTINFNYIHIHIHIYIYIYIYIYDGLNIYLNNLISLNFL